MLGRKVLVSAGFLTGIAAGVFLGARQRVQFRDQVAFITGGSRGLGLVLAREFALRGACVAISARDAEELARAEAQLRSKTDRVLVIPADMTMREEAEGAIQNAIEYFGRVDVLVNNEGTISVGLAETMTTDDYRESINTHFWGPLISMSANRAARQIIDACARGDAEIVLSICKISRACTWPFPRYDDRFTRPHQSPVAAGGRHRRRSSHRQRELVEKASRMDRWSE
jgi:hypothetical protein